MGQAKSWFGSSNDSEENEDHVSGYEHTGAGKPHYTAAKSTGGGLKTAVVGKWFIEDPAQSSGMQGVRIPGKVDPDGERVDAYFEVQQDGSIKRIV